MAVVTAEKPLAPGRARAPAASAAGVLRRAHIVRPQPRRSVSDLPAGRWDGGGLPEPDLAEFHVGGMRGGPRVGQGRQEGREGQGRARPGGSAVPVGRSADAGGRGSVTFPATASSWTAASLEAAPRSRSFAGRGSATTPPSPALGGRPWRPRSVTGARTPTGATVGGGPGAGRCGSPGWVAAGHPERAQRRRRRSRARSMTPRGGLRRSDRRRHA